MEILVLVRQVSILVNEGRRLWCLLDPVETESGPGRKTCVLFCFAHCNHLYLFALEPEAEVGTCVLKKKKQKNEGLVLLKNANS